MAITVGTAFTQFTTPSYDGQFYIQYSITIAPDQNMLVVALAGAYGGVNSILFNGVSFGAAKISRSSGNTGKVAMYDLLNPSVGTYNLRINLGNGGEIRTVIVPLSGVDPTTPRGTAVFGLGGFSPPTVATATTTAGDVVIDIINCQSSLTVGTGQTELLNTPTSEKSNTTFFFHGSSYEVATGASTVMSWNHTGDFVAHAAIPYKPNPYETPRSIIQIGNIENYTISSPTASLLGTDTHTQSITNTTWSKSLTIPVGTEQVYVGFGQRLNNATGMSLSGGGSGTKVVSLNGGVAGQPIAELWRIKNSTTGVNTLTVTVSSAGIGALSIFYVKGIDPTTPEISTNSVDADASQPSLAMTTVAGGLVLDFASNYVASTGTGTPSGLQSEVLDVYVNQVNHVSSYLASTSTSTNIGWTLTDTNNTAYVAVALQPNRYQTPVPIIQLGSIGNSNILLSST